MPLSAKQMEYLALAWQCFETEPKIDYTKFAQVAGLKTPASARELMRVTKNKLKDEYGALSSGMQSTNANGTNGTPVKPKATPKKRKTKGTSGDDEESPTKKAKGKASKSPVKTENVDGEEGEDLLF